MSGYIVSAPRCYIDIYPYEGGKYTISGNDAAFISISTSKSISNGGSGQFTLNLAPGGPNGVNGRPSWAEVITPSSLVVIGMRRAGRSAITMVGVVVTTSESMQRQSDKVARMVRIQGEDFTRIFSIFSYYDLTFLLGIGASATGPLGLPSNVGDALQGAPNEVGSVWYNKIMAGPGGGDVQPGILSQMAFAYKQGRPTFFQLMSTWFEAYPYPVKIPMMAPFIADQGSWMDKFLTFFPPYFYEFFIQTAPVGYYSAATPATQTIEMEGFSPVSPTLVARVSPLPYLIANGNSENPTYSMDLTLWNALPNFSMDGNHGALAENFSYTETEVKNFYVFVPTWYGTGGGGDNGAISPFSLLFAQWVDIASIHRYGFRPNNVQLKWFSDPNGTLAQQLAATGQDLSGLVDELSLRPVAYHEPTPSMLRGTVSMELRPDIIPGNTFTFAPYRDGVQWKFYIDAVSHTMQFGSGCMTTLNLSRGLTVDDYNNNALLVALHTGNAQRLNGRLTVGIPPGLGEPLLPLNLGNLNRIMSGASRLFAEPIDN